MSRSIVLVKNVIVALMFLLVLSNCEKNISVGSSGAWREGPNKQSEYDESKNISSTNNNSDVNITSSYYSQRQYQDQNSNKSYNQQYSQQNSYQQQYNRDNSVIAYDNQGNRSNNGYASTSSVENNRHIETVDNRQPVNIYLTSPAQQGQVQQQQFYPQIQQKENNENELINAINKSLNGEVRQSALLKEDNNSGQVELSSRDQFAEKKQQQKQSQQQYIIDDNNNYNNVGCNLCLKNNFNNNVKNDTKKVKYSIEPKQEVASRVSYKIQCGNYVNKDSANEVANKIRKAGIQDVKVITENGTSRILVGDFNSKAEGADVFGKIESLNLKDSIFWSYR